MKDIGRKTLTRKEILESKPVRNQLVKWEKEENGQVKLLIPRRRVWWLNVLAKIFYLPDQRTALLDEVGTRVWEMCDGVNSVEDMVEDLCGKYKLNRREAELSLFKFLRELGRRGLIGFQIEMKGGS